jgi:hypothetical protein
MTGLKRVVTFRVSEREHKRLSGLASQRGVEIGVLLRSVLARLELPCGEPYAGEWRTSTLPVCQLPPDHRGLRHWWNDPVTGTTYAWDQRDDRPLLDACG